MKRNKLKIGLGVMSGLVGAIALASAAYGQDASIDTSISSSLMGVDGTHQASDMAASVRYSSSGNIAGFDSNFSATYNRSLSGTEYNSLVSGTLSRDIGDLNVSGTAMHYSTNDIEMGVLRAGVSAPNLPGSPGVGYIRDTLGGEIWDANVGFSGEGPYDTRWNVNATRMWGDHNATNVSGTLSRDLGNGTEIYGRVTGANAGNGNDVTGTVGFRRNF